MRQVAKKGLITAVAAGGALAVTGGYAYADAGAAATAAGSPGVLSGNSVQVPVHVPVNACGNTVDVVGLLNPAFGNTCANDSHASAAMGGGAVARGRATDSPGVASGNSVQVPVHVPINACGNSVDVVGALNPTVGNSCANHSSGPIDGGAQASGGATGSPGVGSGNSVQVPVHVPINACGNSVDVVGLLNPAAGNSCANEATPPVIAPPVAEPPQRVTPDEPAPRHSRQARHAKPRNQEMLAHTGADQVGVIGATGVGAMLGGFVLYRRARAVRR